MNSLTKVRHNDKLSTRREFMVEKESLKIHFGGKDCIDIETLRDALDATLKSLEAIANETLSKEDHCKFIVENVQKGSFEIFISVVKDIVANIEVAIGTVASIVTIFTGLVSLRKFLKGRKPKSIEDKDDGKVITNVDGDAFFMNNPTFNVYIDNSDIEKHLARLSKSVANDSDRTSLVIEEYDENGELKGSVEYDKEALVQTSTAIEVEKLTDDYEINEFSSSASIKNACFVGDSKWILRITALDRETSVAVEDNDFLEKVQKGEISLSGATRIRALFESRTRICKKGENGSTKYALKKVLEIKKEERVAQISIDEISQKQ